MLSRAGVAALAVGFAAGSLALRVIPYTETGEISPQVSLPGRSALARNDAGYSKGQRK
ncbi:MAG: hypothetical protein ACK4JD_03145 [Thermoflexales bacterium]